MKIDKISLVNFKAIENFELDPNGFSVILMGGNKKGKTTALRSFFDRINGSKNKNILRTGADNGVQVIEFTDGTVIKWEINSEGGEKLTLTTKEGIIVKNGVLSQIKAKYFGEGLFNINKFLALSAADKTEKLLKLIGVDFSLLDKEYDDLYKQRTKANANFDLLSKNPISEPVVVEENKSLDVITKEITSEEVVLTELNSRILKENESLINSWAEKEKEQRKEVDEFNRKQNDIKETLKEITDEYNLLKSAISYFSEFFDYNSASLYFETTQKPEHLKEYIETPRPQLKQSVTTTPKLEGLKVLYSKETDKMWKYQAYLQDLNDYEDYILKLEEAKKLKDSLNEKMNLINEKKKEALKLSHLPEGFSIGENNETLYNGYPLTEECQSLSSLYIAALKLAALNLGELKTIHFESSSLDKFSLAEVYKFAESIDLQLLIEKPDFEGGELKYEICEF